jgi:hypothetical protein
MAKAVLVWIRFCRSCAVPSLLPNNLKILDRYQTARALQRIASLIPVRVVLSCDHMQKVTLNETEVVWIWRLVVIQRFDNLRLSVGLTLSLLVIGVPFSVEQWRWRPSAVC